jgi:hypothetical protein
MPIPVWRLTLNMCGRRRSIQGPRDAHYCFAIYKDIFAEWLEDNLIASLNLVALVWLAVKVKGSKPLSRSDAATLVFWDKFYLFGCTGITKNELMGDL